MLSWTRCLVISVVLQVFIKFDSGVLNSISEASLLYLLIPCGSSVYVFMEFYSG